MFPPTGRRLSAHPRYRLVALLLIFSIILLALPKQLAPIIPSAEAAGSSTVVISQVYGGGGATTGSPTYKNDFIELFNRGASAVNLAGWSVQYASATGTGAWSVSAVCPTGPCSLAPGQYFLVQEASAANALGGSLPTFDA